MRGLAYHQLDIIVLSLQIVKLIICYLNDFIFSSKANRLEMKSCRVIPYLDYIIGKTVIIIHSKIQLHVYGCNNYCYHCAYAVTVSVAFSYVFACTKNFLKHLWSLGRRGKKRPRGKKIIPFPEPITVARLRQTMGREMFLSRRVRIEINTVGTRRTQSTQFCFFLFTCPSFAYEYH